MLGDVILAEPRALIGFAGPARDRRRRSASRCPRASSARSSCSSTASSISIVERRELQDTLRRLLDLLRGPADAARMTYAEALARLLALRGGEHAGMRPGLERIEALLEALGHPEQSYTLAQVGGTNGKGSVATMLAADPQGRRPARRSLHLAPPRLVPRAHPRERRGHRRGRRGGRRGGARHAGGAPGRQRCSRRPPRWRSTTSPASDVDVAVLEVGLGRPLRCHHESGDRR